MSSFRSALGEEFVIERRLPSIGWKPRLRSVDGDPSGLFDFGDDLGILAILGLIVAAIFLLIIVLPLLLFVAEVALVIALIIPLTVLALLVGLKQHTVVLRLADTGAPLEQRSVHGLIGSVRAARALKSAALAGAYRT